VGSVSTCIYPELKPEVACRRKLTGFPQRFLLGVGSGDGVCDIGGGLPACWNMNTLNASIAAVLRMYLGRAKTEIEGEPKGHKGELHREGCDFEVEISWQGWRISLVGPGLNPKN